LQRLLPEPNRLFPALHSARRKHLPPRVIRDFDTPTDHRSVCCESHFASLIHDLQAPCLEYVSNGWRSARRQADPENQREPQCQRETLIPAYTAFQDRKTSTDDGQIGILHRLLHDHRRLLAYIPIFAKSILRAFTTCTS